MLTVLTALLIATTVGRIIRKDVVSECLLRRTLYHHTSGDCLTPLDQGPCSAGSLLVPDSQPGTLTCSPLSLPEYCHGHILPSGQVECGPDHTMNHYKRGRCSQGQLLLPYNWRVDTRPCPQGFSCRSAGSSQQYNSARRTIKDRWSVGNSDEMQYMKDFSP